LSGAAHAAAADPALATIVLAAGAGRRFGGRKQLARIDGEPMLARVLGAAGGWAGTQVVVLGAAAEEIGAMPIFAGWEVEVAADWELGQGASLRAGLGRAGGAEAALIFLGDLPWLRREAVARVLAAAAAQEGPAAFRAVDGATPAHPVLIRGELLDRAREAPDGGLGGMLRGEDVVPVPCEGLGVVRDVDVPDDLPDTTNAGEDR
jgi:CTP:molybdopterin cytidylyltransferase MocA